jgi:hypothetical protein
MVEPIKNPAGEPVDWEDVSTWFCFDCGTMDADEYQQFDGFIRCAHCAARWSEHHLDIEDWR